MSKKELYFCHDPESGFETFETAGEALKHAQDAIDMYMDDGWMDGVEQVVTGVITKQSTKTNVTERPPESELDEEGFCEEGIDWGHNDFEYTCNYEMMPVGNMDEDDNQETEATMA